MFPGELKSVLQSSATDNQEESKDSSDSEVG
jgi:hypothetical protein